MRVPMIARLPGRIPPGSTCEQLATTMDFLPTMCALSGAALPQARLDGHFSALGESHVIFVVLFAN